MKLEKLKEILQNCREIDGYKIIEEVVEAQEFFLIKTQLDMNRTKKVRHLRVAVYKDFEEDGVKYKGSAAVNIHPTMDENEVRQAVSESAFAAGFVKNKYYPLVKPSVAENLPLPFDCGAAKDENGLTRLMDSVLHADNNVREMLNSAEIFLNRVSKRLVNSEGIDLKQEKNCGELEFINEAQGQTEAVELFRDIKFAVLNPELISEKIREINVLCQERAIAEPMPALKKHTVLLSGEPVRDFFQYYYMQTSAQSAHDGIATVKPGEMIQGSDVKGDLINLSLEPMLKDSAESELFDLDGIRLEKAEIIKNGNFERYWGDNQYSYYMQAAPTGIIKNVVVQGGTRTLAELKTEPFLELLVFSHFQMDEVTGDFGGEIRLGRYFDGEKTILVTGGSISGNIKDVQGEMYFSRELQQDNNFQGPQTIKMFNITVTGQE